MAKPVKNSNATNATASVATSQDAATVVLNAEAASDPSGVNGPDGTHIEHDKIGEAVVSNLIASSSVVTGDASQGAAGGAGANASPEAGATIADILEKTGAVDFEDLVRLAEGGSRLLILIEILSDKSPDLARWLTSENRELLVSALVDENNALKKQAEVGNQVVDAIRELASSNAEFSAWSLWQNPADLVRSLAQETIALKEVARSRAADFDGEEKRAFQILGDVRLDGVLEPAGKWLPLTYDQHRELAGANVCHSDWNAGKGV